MTDTLHPRRRLYNAGLQEPDRVGRLFAVLGWVSGAAMAGGLVLVSSGTIPMPSAFDFGFPAPRYAQQSVDPITTSSIGSAPISAMNYKQLRSEVDRLRDSNATLRAQTLGLARRLKHLEIQYAGLTPNGVDDMTTGSIKPSGDRTARAQSKVSVKMSPFDPTNADLTEQDPADSNVKKMANPARPLIMQTVSNSRFGADLGGAESLSGLKALWVQLKADFPYLLAGLSPVAAVQEANGEVRLRLVAGPFKNAADVAQLCAVLRPEKAACATAIYDGQRIAMR